jgi:hypothetical protein
MAGLMALTACNNNPVKLIASATIDAFPSGSSVEVFNGQMIIIGDDATQILITDFDYKKIDSIVIDSSGVVRISKSIKPDYESSVIINNKRKAELIVFGSGSTKNRENILRVQLPAQKQKAFTIQPLPSLYQLCRTLIDKEINIEGAAVIGDQLILANRAHINQPENMLVVLPLSAIDSNTFTTGTACKVMLPKEKDVVGISGLAYEPTKDILWFTASTEQTTNTHDDGAIGDSYIGYIQNAKTAIRNQSISATSLINLSEINEAFKGQKIESLAIEAINNGEVIIHLVADNDDGTTQLFKITYQLSL